MKYDDASWHYGGDFPKGLPPEAGATHIGMFLGWAILRGLVGELHREESVESLRKMRAREMTGRDFLLQECDEKFTDEDLNEEGNAFAAAYYSSKYLDDYFDALPEVGNAYDVADTWDNFDTIAAILDDRFAEWKRTQGV